jgi:hypothetical protein
MRKSLKKNCGLLYWLLIVVTLAAPATFAAVEAKEAGDTEAEAGSDLAIPPDAIILKDEEPLTVNARLGAPQKIVNIRAVQKEVLNIAIPEESPEEVEERAPVEE